MIVEVEKEDIFKISDTIFPIDGCTAFKLSSDDNAFGIKEILLRNILKTFSEQYKIVSVEDFELDRNGFEVVSLIIKTNLPWEAVESLNNTY